jgi:hypothetical protein
MPTCHYTYVKSLGHCEIHGNHEFGNRIAIRNVPTELQTPRRYIPAMQQPTVSAAKIKASRLPGVSG